MTGKKIFVVLRARTEFDLARAEEAYLCSYPPGGYKTRRAASGAEDHSDGRHWSRMERYESAG